MAAAPQPQPSDFLANLRTAVAGSYGQIATQLYADGAQTTKLFGLLAFFGVAGTFLLGQSHPLAHGRILLLIGCAAGVLLCLLGTVRASNLDPGPLPGTFYAEYGGGMEHEYLEQLLADLIYRAAGNQKKLDRRQRVLIGTLGVPASLVLAFVPVNLAG